MPSLGKTVFHGESGTTYKFRVFALGARFRKLSGVYIVTNRSRSENGEQRHETLYVGQTDNLSRPFERHRKVKELTQRGANCICLLSDASADSRVAKQRDLVAALHPVCNA